MWISNIYDIEEVAYILFMGKSDMIWTPSKYIFRSTDNKCVVEGLYNVGKIKYERRYNRNTRND